MSYNHLTKTELIFIEKYHTFGLTGRKIAKKIKRGHETVYRIIRLLKQGLTALEIHLRYKANKAKCGRKKIQLPPKEKAYIKRKVHKGWTPDVIIGRGNQPIACSVRTLYRMFESGEFDVTTLPMQGKRKPNGHQEKRGRQRFRRSIRDRNREYPHLETEFGHLEGDTIVGHQHQSGVITLVERVSKCIFALKPIGRKAIDIENAINHWLSQLPINLFKSIIFDCGKEFSNWKNISNQNDIDIYFADPGTPSQRGLNEHSNGLLRRHGLPKQTDFNLVSQDYISEVARKRNNIPRKSLGYLTPIEYFMKHVDKSFDESMLSRLI